MHETAEIADVVLPATSFAEKDGTFTNSERRVQRVRKAIDPVGDSRPDWVIIKDVAQRVSAKLGLELEHEFDYSHPSEIFDEMASLHAQHRRNLRMTASKTRAAFSGRVLPRTIPAPDICTRTTSPAVLGPSL